MSEDNLTLTAPHYDTPGSVHCGVVRSSFISCGDAVARVEDGDQVRFERVGNTAARQGDEYVFSKP